ncbi:hypothetical protein [Sphingomonas sp.]|uniref:hypothetical protein n=1 Tax=Sphingomonas sp. TaxID=28214 RepID=UPI001DB8438C|nr:hypothetical protein [Sphingomonas sp.]MBX9795672.1 hypothetical protein [Sphingomonas sp.]
MTETETTPAPDATDAAEAAVDAASGRLAALRDTVLDKRDAAMDTARESAAQAARRTADTIEGNPLAVLVGGLAVGVLAGAMLPRSRHETRTIGSVGKKLNQGAVAVARAAREAGVAELSAAGLTRAAAREGVKRLVAHVGDAAKNAGQAAAKAGTEQAKTGFKPGE